MLSLGLKHLLILFLTSNSENIFFSADVSLFSLPQFKPRNTNVSKAPLSSESKRDLHQHASSHMHHSESTWSMLYRTTIPLHRLWNFGTVLIHCTAYQNGSCGVQVLSNHIDSVMWFLHGACPKMWVIVYGNVRCIHMYIINIIAISIIARDGDQKGMLITVSKTAPKGTKIVANTTETQMIYI